MSKRQKQPHTPVYFLVCDFIFYWICGKRAISFVCACVIHFCCLCVCVCVCVSKLKKKNLPEYVSPRSKTTAHFSNPVFKSNFAQGYVVDKLLEAGQITWRHECLVEIEYARARERAQFIKTRNTNKRKGSRFWKLQKKHVQNTYKTRIQQMGGHSRFVNGILVHHLRKKFLHLISYI